MVYWKTAEALLRAVVTIRRRDVSMEKKIDALTDLKALLELCEREDGLSDLTAIYRGQKTETILGYDISAVEAFVGMMMVRYPGFRWMREPEGQMRILVEQDGSRKLYEGPVLEIATSPTEPKPGLVAISLTSDGFIHQFAGMVGAQRKLAG